MTEELRPFGKLGCLPGNVPTNLKMLTYYVAGDLPKAPVSVPVPTFSPWGMLGNDRYGDCGVAGLQHGFEADATITKTKERFATEQQTIDYYLKYTNGQDSGVVLSDFLNYVRKHGYYDQKITAYAPVATNDVPTLQTAIFMYGFAYAGITVTAGMQQAFARHAAWDATACSGAIVGGHCIPVVGYDDHYLYVITWGGVQRITYSAWHTIATESWGIITSEFEAAHGDGRGVSISALKTDLNRLR